MTYDVIIISDEHDELSGLHIPADTALGAAIKRVNSLTATSSSLNPSIYSQVVRDGGSMKVLVRWRDTATNHVRAELFTLTAQTTPVLKVTR